MQGGGGYQYQRHSCGPIPIASIIRGVCQWHSCGPVAFVIPGTLLQLKACLGSDVGGIIPMTMTKSIEYSEEVATAVTTIWLAWQLPGPW